MEADQSRQQPEAQGRRQGPLRRRQDLQRLPLAPLQRELQPLQSCHLQHLRLRPARPSTRRQQRHRRRPGQRGLSEPEFQGQRDVQQQAGSASTSTPMATSPFSGVTLKNCEVTGYGREGIRFLAAPAASINDRSTSTPHDNRWGGLKANGSKITAIRITSSITSRSGTTTATADGERHRQRHLPRRHRRRAHPALRRRTTTARTAPPRSASGRPWANHITIEYCESYNNNTRTSTDGGGFDFDWDVKNSVDAVQLLAQQRRPRLHPRRRAPLQHRQHLRYNVSQNDGRKNGRAGMQIWGNVTNSNIYNNTVYITPTGNSTPPASTPTTCGAERPSPRTSTSATTSSTPPAA